jgi:hypothetical protein
MNKELAAAFIAAKKKFAPAIKASTNPHYKSKYADLAACIEAVDDAFLESGIVMYQETIENTEGVIVETILLHESGDSLRCGQLFVPAQKRDPQGFGSALTYARRYSLMAAVGIAPEDDDGNAAGKKQQEKRPTAADPALLEQITKISAELTNGFTKEQKTVWMKSIFGTANFNEVRAMPKEKLESFFMTLQEAKRKAQEMAN